jgi:NitT/TauT family transport system permease protein
MTGPRLAAPVVFVRRGSWPIDILVFAAGLAVLYGISVVARTWLAPVLPAADITRDPKALPVYAAWSFLRIVLAYGLSLAFALAYGYAAARSPAAERVLIPVLDLLQSIPVLSFLPGVMLAMVALFPHRQLGVELGCILLIFTGQAWNMAFSFYASLKGIPAELHEAARVFRYTWLQRFTKVELPFATIGLIWNSMMSVAGGWFFLMACEMFVLGRRDFRLPGLGSYLQTAAGEGDLPAILWGLLTMVGLIVALDLAVWRPLIAWSERFRFEQVKGEAPRRSLVLDALRGSRAVAWIRHAVAGPAWERIGIGVARRASGRVATPRGPERGRKWVWRVMAVLPLAVVLYAAARAMMMLTSLGGAEAGQVLRGAGATFLRVFAALLLGALWTVPAGVAIGSSPRLARFAQPLVQIAASVPATALFPVLLLLLIRHGGGMGAAALVLMLLGTQWYILFNVIAGTMALPADLKEVALAFRFGLVDRWRRLILPGIFPYLLTGLVTAAGGAWNASIVAEYFRFGGRVLSVRGLGSVISQASDTGNFPQLLAATIAMAVMVVTLNRVVWRPLFRLAATRFSLES